MAKKTTTTKKTAVKKVTKAKKTTRKNKYSTNPKLERVLCEIEKQLLNLGGTRKEALEEIKHHKRDFPKECDFNIAQFGGVLAAHDDIRAMYKKAGYKSLDKLSNDAIWETYKRQVGFVARKLTK